MLSDIYFKGILSHCFSYSFCTFFSFFYLCSILIMHIYTFIFFQYLLMFCFLQCLFCFILIFGDFCWDIPKCKDSLASLGLPMSPSKALLNSGSSISLFSSFRIAVVLLPFPLPTCILFFCSVLSIVIIVVLNSWSGKSNSCAMSGSGTISVSSN